MADLYCGGVLRVEERLKNGKCATLFLTISSVEGRGFESVRVNIIKSSLISSITSISNYSYFKLIG